MSQHPHRHHYHNVRYPDIPPVYNFTGRQQQDQQHKCVVEHVVVDVDARPDSPPGDNCGVDPCSCCGVLGWFPSTYRFLTDGPDFRIRTKETHCVDTLQPVAARRMHRRISDMKSYHLTEQRVTGQLQTLLPLNVVREGQLLELPFKPPCFWEYVVDLISGAVIVTQYVVTMLAALTLAQAQVEGSVKESSGPMYGLIRSILVLYPLLTLTLLLLAHSEVVIRRFMYYRFLSLGILVDWEDRGLLGSWFTVYYVLSLLMVNVWAVYAAFVSGQRQSLYGLTAWLIPNFQTLLLLKFYNTYIVNAESRLVTVNDFVENEPEVARAIIDGCDVVPELWVQAYLIHASKHMRLAVAKADGSPLLDLAQMRNRDARPAGRPGEQLPGMVNALARELDLQAKANYRQSHEGSCLTNSITNIFVRELYATVFVCKLIRHRPNPSKVTAWPYKQDLVYLRTLGYAAAMCWLLVLAAEGYGLYLATYRAPVAEAGMYGSSSCSHCYGDLYASSSASSCSEASRNSSLCSMAQVAGWASSPGAAREVTLQGATTGLCLLQRLLQATLNMTREAVAAYTLGQCPEVLGNATDILQLAGIAP